MNTTADRTLNLARRTILTVIGLAVLTVILAIFLHAITAPDQLVHRKIEAISTDYYENYYFDRLITVENLDHYADRGFPKITLAQLLLYEDQKYSDLAPFLTSYCDPDRTSITIYPLSPYNRSDYRIDYHYACNFD